MTGPLAQMFGLLSKENEDAYQGVHRKSPHIDRETFNTRLSPVFGRTRSMPSDHRDASGEPPIVLGEDDAPPRLIPSDFPTLGYNDQQPGQGPMPFRDPGQAGPSPPVDPRILAQMFQHMSQER